MQDSEPHHRLSSWLAAVGPEITANAGASDHSFCYINQPALRSPDQVLLLSFSSFDFFDQTHLYGFAGYAYLRARRYDEAMTLLFRTMTVLADDAVKQCAVVLADLAAPTMPRET